MEGWEWTDEVECVVYDQQKGNDERLSDFDPVYAREDVDAVWAEDGDREHVDVVQGAEIEEPA